MVIPRNQYINSTNIAVDSSINFYLSKAAKLNTKLSLSIAVPPDIFVSDLDISITLGNLLSNAMEALEKLQDDAERKLSVSILYKMSTLYLEIKNTFSGSLKKIDKVTFKSTKKDSRNHGYGLSNVNEVVEKYDGISSFTTEGNWFIVNITLFSEKRTLNFKNNAVSFQKKTLNFKNNTVSFQKKTLSFKNNIVSFQKKNSQLQE